MNLRGIWESIPRFDEIRVLDRPFDLGEAPCLLLGLTREGRALSAWFLREEDEKEPPVGRKVKTRRDEMLSIRLEDAGPQLLHVQTLTIGGWACFSHRSGETALLEPLPLNQAFILRAFLEAGLRAEGWRERDFDRMALCQLELEGEYPAIPLKEGPVGEIRLDFQQGFACGLAGKKLTLDFIRTSPKKYTFTDSKDGSVHEFYLTGVRLWDPWPEYEQLFAGPRMTERVPPEILAEQKRGFFEETLPNICPRGMRVPVVEYESAEGLSLDFYSREYLAEKRDASGPNGATAFLMKPDNPAGPHGFPARAAVIQAPLPPDAEKLAAEALFYHLPFTMEPVVF